MDTVASNDCTACKKSIPNLKKEESSSGMMGISGNIVKIMYLLNIPGIFAAMKLMKEWKYHRWNIHPEHDISVYSIKKCVQNGWALLGKNESIVLKNSEFEVMILMPCGVICEGSCNRSGVDMNAWTTCSLQWRNSTEYHETFGWNINLCSMSTFKSCVNAKSKQKNQTEVSCPRLIVEEFIQKFQQLS